MKKIAASVGLFALGASCIQAADDSYSSTEAGKLWKVSASLRGFYDDNFNTAPDGPGRVGSFGFSITPGVSLNWERDMNSLLFSYAYSLMYYEKRHSNSNSHYDQSHLFNGVFNHTFNERYMIRVSDSFVIGQEPGTLSLQDGTGRPSSQYVPGDNIRNSGSVVFNAELTPLFGLEAGYDNTLFDYSARGSVVSTNGQPSRSGIADRIEQSFHLDGRWAVTPQTTAVLGYQFGLANYTGNEVIDIGTNGVASVSKNKNSRSHYGYVGADHIFNPDLQGSARVGIRSTEYYNDASGRSDLSPYVKLSATYVYAPESYLEGGFSYDRNATDLAGVSATKGLTQSQQSATAYATLYHRIVPNLFGSLTGQYQHSTFVGGPNDSGTERSLLLGVSLSYKFSRYLSAELGYDYDKVSSSAGRAYDRNKVYAGITGSY